MVGALGMCVVSPHNVNRVEENAQIGPRYEHECECGHEELVADIYGHLKERDKEVCAISDHHRDGA